jgi:imidazolonepropionase-like amidohydrolase
MRYKYLLSALLLYCLIPLGPILSAQDTTAIVGATLIDGTGREPVPDSAIVIEGTRITAVGPRSQVMIPAGARVVDATGKYVTPGLIDVNVHLILTIFPDFYVKYEDQLEEIIIEGAQIALKYGVTTVRDSWGPLEPLLRARDRINAGEKVGSRLLVAGNIVGLGGPFSEYFIFRRDSGESAGIGAWVSPLVQERINAIWEENVGPGLLTMRPEEVRQEMRKYLARGVDFVKVAVSAHGVVGQPLMFTPEVLKVIADEVHAAGKIYETHTATPESLRLAVESGVDLLQHPEVLGDQVISDELIELIKEKNIFCGILTRFSFPERAEEERSKYPEWYASTSFYRRDQFEARVKNVRKMIAAGVRLAMATDMGPQSWDLAYRPMSPMLGTMQFETMEDYQTAGASPMDILVASTKTGAEASQMEEDLGTLAVGKIADLLVVNANPLEDISNMRKIDEVMKDGKFIDRDALPEKEIMKFDPAMKFGDYLKKTKR